MTERTRARLGTESESGDIVHVLYIDHILFKNMRPGDFSNPFVRETVGWLDYEDRDCIRIVWDKPNPCGEIKQRATGLVIFKNGILEMRKLGGKFLSNVTLRIHDVYGKGGHNTAPREEANQGATQEIRPEGG